MSRDTATRHALVTAIGGLVSLAAGMGLGRFLYTPALPMMAAEVPLGPAAWGAIASANFAGYLAGALLASLPGLSHHAWHLLLAALITSAATGAGMVLVEDFWLWSFLRALSGIASAFILIFATTLVTGFLRREGRADLASVHFAGVGAGILISALVASPLVTAGGDWRAVWLIGAGLTLAALLVVVRVLPRTVSATPVGQAGPVRRFGLWRLVVSYGCLGFGYAITATFIVQILRESGAGRSGEALVWALVGCAAIPSIALWSRLQHRFGAIRMYQAAMLVLATGVGASTLGGLGPMLIASTLLGGTFMALTAMGLQEAARRAGGDGRAIMALMTASFGLGQMIGPGMAGWLRDVAGTYTVPSLIAVGVLLTGALLVHPISREPAG